MVPVYNFFYRNQVCQSCACLPACLPVCLSVCLPVRPSVCGRTLRTARPVHALQLIKHGATRPTLQGPCPARLPACPPARLPHRASLRSGVWRERPAGGRGAVRKRREGVCRLMTSGGQWLWGAVHGSKGTATEGIIPSMPDSMEYIPYHPIWRKISTLSVFFALFWGGGGGGSCSCWNSLQSLPLCHRRVKRPSRNLSQHLICE